MYVSAVNLVHFLLSRSDRMVRGESEWKCGYETKILKSPDKNGFIKASNIISAVSNCFPSRHNGKYKEEKDNGNKYL